MGIYLILYFISAGLALLFYYLGKKKEGFLHEKISGFLIFLMIFFFTLAMYTKDPIEKLLTTIPAFWQFILTILVGAFAIWKAYLNPLKIKVYKFDREMGEVKKDVSYLKSDVSILKKDVSSIKKDIFSMKKDIFSMKKDIHLIKNKILN